ncbi:hypothetical protein LSUE1_G009708, partial [Lachnellula suecica]
MAALFQRTTVISDDNEGPVVNIAAWIGMTVMIFCVFTRIGSKFKIVRQWTVDDSLIFSTMIFAICHTVTLSVMVSNGLGQPRGNLTKNMIANFEKYGYASQLLYIPTLCLGKLSTLGYLKALAPSGSRYGATNILLTGFVVLWATGAGFAIAFQCSLPHPWAILSAQCLNRAILWDAIGALDILTDICIIILPAYLVWTLQMPLSKKLLVVVVF